MLEYFVQMLDNADTEAIQSDSLEELAEFYACTQDLIYILFNIMGVCSFVHETYLWSPNVSWSPY